MNSRMVFRVVSKRKSLVLAMLVTGTCFSTLGCLYTWVPFITQFIGNLGSGLTGLGF